MILSIIKFFHVTCGVSFFGIIIAAFFYIASSINKRDQSLINYSIRASYFGDAIILLCIFIQLATSMLLVSAGHFTLKVPWIFIAYHAFGFLIILWLLTLFIKKFYLSRKVISPYSLRSFYFLNIIMMLIFIIIIHDAVMQSTGLEFLFRN
ncbi:MAG: hypothetical protein P4M12_08735 [Gammaproteobacteria bacterium]|nr:hypothetical protein [Gammaproteobacteria bacterium]